MAVELNTLKKLLEMKFPNAQKISIEDFVGDQNHYSITVIDKAFKGLTILAQHRIVYNSISKLLEEDLHAIDLKTHHTEPEQTNKLQQNPV